MPRNSPCPHALRISLVFAQWQHPKGRPAGPRRRRRSARCRRWRRCRGLRSRARRRFGRGRIWGLTGGIWKGCRGGWCGQRSRWGPDLPGRDWLVKGWRRARIVEGRVGGGGGGRVRIGLGRRSRLHNGRVLEGGETALRMERLAGWVRTSMPGELGDLTVGEDHYMFEM